MDWKDVIDRLKTRQGMAAAGAIVGMVLYTIYALTLGGGFWSLWQIPFATGLTALVAYMSGPLIISGVKNSEYWVAGGAVVGLVFGLLTSSIIGAWGLCLMLMLPYSIYRGYALSVLDKSKGKDMRHAYLSRNIMFALSQLGPVIGLVHGIMYVNMLSGLLQAIVLVVVFLSMALPNKIARWVFNRMT